MIYEPFNQFLFAIKNSKELSILVEEIQKYGVIVKESKFEDNYVSYYSNYYKTIGLDLACDSYMIGALLHEFGHHLQTLDSNYSNSWDKYYQEEDAWNRGEGFYVKVLGKPVLESYHKQKHGSLTTYEDWQGYSCQYFHWDLNDIGTEPSKREGIIPSYCDITLTPSQEVTITAIDAINAKYKATIAAINKKYAIAAIKDKQPQISLSAAKPISVIQPIGFNWSILIAGITTCSLLIGVGGVIAFNSLQPIPPQEQCTDYNCIF